jgi:hypothetical protein
MYMGLTEPARRLLAAKMGIEPGVLRRAAPALARRYAHEWTPVEAWAAQLARLPAGLLRFLADHPRGRLLISDHTAYEPGSVAAQGRTLTNVAFLALADLDDPLAGLEVTARLLDHLLGCNGEPAGAWLSEGGGIAPALVALGERIGRLFGLGYGFDEIARRSRRDYLARSLACCVADRRRLNTADPLMERALLRSLLDERFWERLT